MSLAVDETLQHYNNEQWKTYHKINIEDNDRQEYDNEYRRGYNDNSNNSNGRKDHNLPETETLW